MPMAAHLPAAVKTHLGWSDLRSASHPFPRLRKGSERRCPHRLGKRLEKATRTLPPRAQDEKGPDFGTGWQDGQDTGPGSPRSEPSCKSCSSCQNHSMRIPPRDHPNGDFDAGAGSSIVAGISSFTP